MKITDAYGREHSLPGPYRSIYDAERANKRFGHHWFEPDSLRFFGSKIESGMIHGRLFISSEQQPTHSPDDPIFPRRFSIRVAGDNGSVTTVGEFQQFADRDEALDELRRLARVKAT